MLGLNEHITSVDAPASSEADKPLLETLSDNHENDPEHILEDENLRQRLENWLKQLTTNQREVISRRYGLLGCDRMTLEESRRSYWIDSGSEFVKFRWKA